ncbi:MAG: HigA family addiction module antidote protein [Gemmatimonadota bacterium]|nr:MAG: HigA family addiction module antidote protein [Gemmatimonadota bacterium]
MMIKKDIHSDVAIPPGEYLEEVISELGMTKDELARRMNRPAPKLSAIFTGNKAITPDTALQLEKVVGVPAHIWTGLEAEYRLALARQQEIRELQRLRDESRLITKFCYAKLAALGYIAKRTKPTDKVQELQRFFGVTSLKNVPALKRYQVVFRHGRHGKVKRSPEAVAAWLRIGELQGQKTECAPFNKHKLENTLPTLRHMTRQSPEKFEADLRGTLSDAGVVLVLCSHLPKTYAHGATFWLGQKKAVLMLTIRGSWADIFWFSLFHELCHLLYHGKNMVFIEGEDTDMKLGKQEEEADQFAADILIPPNDYAGFLENGSYSSRDIRSFADHLGIDHGIIVGRLQHDKQFKNSWHNDLRSRYTWKHRS